MDAKYGLQLKMCEKGLEPNHAGVVRCAWDESELEMYGIHG